MPIWHFFYFFVILLFTQQPKIYYNSHKEKKKRKRRMFKTHENQGIQIAFPCACCAGVFRALLKKSFIIFSVFVMMACPVMADVPAGYTERTTFPTMSGEDYMKEMSVYKNAATAANMLGITSGEILAEPVYVSVVCQENQYLSGNTCLDCPPEYPNSNGTSDGINQCYKTVVRGCTQNPCVCPEGSDCTCSECSCDGGAYVEYHDGTTSGTVANETCSQQVATATSRPGYFFDDGEFLACPKGTYKADSGNATSCTPASEGYYVDTTGATSQKQCPAGYRGGSDNGRDEVTDCYSDTKSRSWTGSQVNGTVPTGCSVTEWNSCSKSACEYVVYSNETGNGDGALKSGCATNNESCTKTVKTVSANNNYYVEGTTCKACSSEYPNSEGGNIGATQCYYTCQSKTVQNASSVTPVSEKIYNNGASVQVCTYNVICNNGYTASGNGTANPSCDVTTITCPAGKYLPKGSTECATCLENNYCEANSYSYSTEQSQGLTACHVAFTNSGSESCTIAHATGSTKSYTQTCYHNESVAGSTSSSACTGTADCGTKSYGTCYVGSCDTGYSKNQATNATSCVADTYTITYNLNGGTNNSNNPANYTIETNTITLGAPTKTGYAFGGWYDNSGLTGTAVTQIAKGTTGNKTFYAKWTLASYSCAAGKYLPKGSTECATCLENNYCEANSYSYSTEQSQGLTACHVAFTNSGSESCTIAHATGSTKSYTQTCYHNESVAGSTSSSACTGTADCGTKSYGTCYVGSCDTGYSKNQATNATSCVADTYTITYNLNGGTNNSNNPANYTIETNTITLGTPTKTGYTFGGWYTTSNFSGSAVTQIAKGTTGNKTFYAKWILASVTCHAGQYLPANSTTCATCPEDSYCSGGSFNYPNNSDNGIKACTTGLVAPQGTTSAGGCGKIMYVDGTKLYLTSEKRTSPALAVRIDGVVYYASMTSLASGAKPMNSATSKSLRTRINGIEYSIHDNTVQGE